MSKKLFYIGIPFLCLAVYWFGGAAVILSTGVSPVLGTLVLDLLLAFALWQYRREFSFLVMPKITKTEKYTLIALFIGVWLFGQITGAWALSLGPSTDYGAYKEAMGTSDITQGLFLTLVAAPVAEEFLFRGLIYSMWKKVMSPRFAFIGQALLFALIHGTQAHLLPIFMLGAFCCYMFERTGNIWVSIGVHIVYNVFSILFVGLSIPTFLTEPFVFVLADFLLMAYVTSEYRKLIYKTGGAVYVSA